MNVEWASMVLVGRIVRAHGLRGQVVIASQTDFGEERFAPGAKVWRSESSSLTVTESHPQGDRWVVGFENVTTIEDAEALRGTELRIPEGERMALGPGEYYLY